ncbi:MAG: 3-phosphoshikimate 1-carboxyvinyltransferase [Opitutaceae bacterium]|jgi:3-phosphoshikimate 1-carboxyvinyltransferase
MPLPPLLPIPPFPRPVRGEAAVPGSKSITNRAMLLAALGDGPTVLTGALFSDDTRIMADGLRRLGFEVGEDPARGEIRIVGRGGAIPARAAELHVGLAGTAARFLTALCAASEKGVYRLDGIPQMRKRPMRGLVEALRSLGADIRCPGEEGHFPLDIHARGLRGGEVRVDAGESSQMVSALMLVAPLAGGPLVIEAAGKLRMPFVQMTRRLMEEFGAGGSAAEGPKFVIGGRQTKIRPPGRFAIEPDATAASYFLALPLATRGTVDVPNLRAARGLTLQGDAAFIEVLNALGATVGDRGSGVRSAWDGSAGLRGVDRDFSLFSDTFLTLAALSPILGGPTRISGIAHTRKQESDRVAGAARELRKLGQEVVETEDSLAVAPRPDELRRIAGSGPVEIETYGDHRFAMSFAILGCRDLRGDGRPWIAVKDPSCCAKTFPDFFESLESLRKGSLAAR